MAALPGMKVIVGFDRTEQAFDALALGAGLRQALDAELLVAVANEAAPLEIVDAPTYHDAVREYFDGVREAATERLGGLSYEWREMHDTAAHGLQELAERERADLIVVGSTHRGPVGRVLPGSVGESLLLGAPCAVSIAPRGHAGNEQRFARIASAIDGSAEAGHALRFAAGLASQAKAKLTLLTVARRLESSPIAAYWPSTLGDYQSTEDDDHQEVLDAALATFEWLGVEGRLLHGQPAESLAEASSDFDLLCMGSRGYGPVRRTLLGGTSSRVVRNARCPVIVVPRGAEEDRTSYARIEKEVKA